MSELSGEELQESLARWASGGHGAEAAVELLIESRYWLERREFLDRALFEAEEGTGVSWFVAHELAETLVCSRGERFLLRLACSLAEPGLTVPMSEIGSIDGRNLARVQEALRTARFGWG
ncbi:MAG: hypothetical protein HKN24_11945 [Acidimicrobiales bacterium]|nr:hypothetical protein [Acidimicrobiales bacterium]